VKQAFAAMFVCSSLLLLARVDVTGVTMSPAAQRFLSRTDAPLARFVAFRRLEASTRGGSMKAWMEACTELSGAGFTYRVLREDGSGTIRGRVLLAALKAEARARETGDADRAALTPVNYEFVGGDQQPDAEGLTRVDVHPLRKDVMLVDGAMFLASTDGDLVRVEGLLSKRPSFWTRRVRVVRRYARIGGIRVPVSMESTADVLIVGTSQFSMTYDYLSVNGEAVPAARSRCE
jgi:hypothetical protein